jgi:hypothetical protein
MNLPAAIPDAHCALHPDRAAVFVCGRCGSFVCGDCQAPQGPLCKACDERRVAALASHIKVSEAIANSFRLPLRQLNAVAAYIAISPAPHVLWEVIAYLQFPPRKDDATGLVAWLGGSTHEIGELMRQLLPFAPRMIGSAITGLIAWVAWLLATGALTLVVAGDLRGRPLTLQAAYSATLRRLIPLLACNVVAMIGGLVGLALCILPGAAFFLCCGLIDPIVLLGEKGPFAAIAASARLTLRAPVVMLVLLALAFGSSVAISWLLSAATAHISEQPGLTQAMSVVQQFIGYLVALPLICGVAYAYVRLDAQASHASR